MFGITPNFTSSSEKLTRWIYGGLLILGGLLGFSQVFMLVVGLLLILEGVFGFSVAGFIDSNYLSSDKKNTDNDTKPKS